jgi:hypothetical protein
VDRKPKPPASKRNSEGTFHPPPTTKKGSRWTSRWGLQGRTVWDWLVLLLAALVATQITVFQALNTEQLEQRLQTIEEQRAQDAAVQTYTD